MKKANRKDSDIVNDIDIKIIIVGDMATGKTSIMERYIDNKFDNNTRATIVPSYKPKKMKINGINYNISCRFWKPLNKNLTLFCKLNESLKVGQHNIILNNYSFPYDNYTINIISKEDIIVKYSYI